MSKDNTLLLCSLLVIVGVVIPVERLMSQVPSSILQRQMQLNRESLELNRRRQKYYVERGRSVPAPYKEERLRIERSEQEIRRQMRQ
jgi:hypothetical protein